MDIEIVARNYLSIPLLIKSLPKKGRFNIWNTENYWLLWKATLLQGL